MRISAFPAKGTAMQKLKKVFTATILAAAIGAGGLINPFFGIAWIIL